MTGHLIHIGWAKAGSTFLQHAFAAHPELDFARDGIAGFRGAYQMAAAASRGSAGMRYRVTSCEDLTSPHGEADGLVIDYDDVRRPGLARRQAEACAMLAELFPAAHILIVTRGFRSMILSSYSQYVRSGGAEDLEALIAGGGSEDPWDYDHVIGLYERAFGGDRLIVLPFELLRDDAGAFLEVLQRRLGIAPFAPAGGRLNPALSPEEMRWYPRLTRALLGLPVGARLRRALLRRHVAWVDRNRLRRPIGWLQRVRPAPPVTAELIPDTLLEAHRGKAGRLRGNPLYAPYAADYLF